jgi:DNA-binding NtrC family response regulator
MSATAGTAKRPADPPLAVRKPNAETRYRLRMCVQQVLTEGYSYREAQDLYREFLLDQALVNAQGVKTKAAERLKISRDHVRDYHARGKELL